jgi:hypothetical protein
MAVGGWKSDRMVNHYTKTTKTEYAKNYLTIGIKFMIEIEKRYCMNCSIEITGRLGRCFARILAVIDTTISKIKILLI